jgi:deoxyribonuclease-4
MSVRFGPAGIPIQCNASSSLEGLRCCHTLGLDAMEMEFVRGVRLSEKSAKEINKLSKELDITMSSHAPYYINFCSVDKIKLSNSRKHLFQAAKITNCAGGRITVFHPGFYLKNTPEEAYELAKIELRALVEKLAQYNIKTILGAETVGKKSAFGSLEENIKLSSQIDQLEPVLDFAHIHARGDYRITDEDDYRKILDMVEKELPGYSKHIHCHFSEINYTEKGERNHLALGTNNTPPFVPFLKVLAENKYNVVVICESPKLDLDALKMQKHYHSIKESGSHVD